MIDVGYTKSSIIQNIFFNIPEILKWNFGN